MGVNNFVQAILQEYMVEHGIDPLSAEGKLFLVSLALLQSPVPSGPTTIYTLTTTVTSNQLKNLHTTPVQLVPAGGSNVIIFPTFINFQYRFGTVPYVTNGDGLFISYGSNPYTSYFESVLLVPEKGFFDKSADQVALVWQFWTNYSAAALMGPASDINGIENQPLQLIGSTGTSDMTTGDGDLIVTVNYTPISLG